MEETEEYEIYGGFAPLYDLFMDTIPYDAWAEYLTQLLRENGVKAGTVAELACGTGQMTIRLARAGYTVIGLDLSEEMLVIAAQRCGTEALLVHQDMREMAFNGTVNAMVCLCDGMNYICSTEDLEKVFACAARYLEEGGVFIFDMKTAYFYEETLGDQTFADNREDASYIWENAYDREKQVNEYLLTLYALVDRDRNLFARTEELHRQRAYTVDTVKRCMERQGLSCEAVYEAFTHEPPKEESERVYFICKK